MLVLIRSCVQMYSHPYCAPSGERAHHTKGLGALPRVDRTENLSTASVTTVHATCYRPQETENAERNKDPNKEINSFKKCDSTKSCDCGLSNGRAVRPHMRRGSHVHKHVCIHLQSHSVCV